MRSSTRSARCCRRRSPTRPRCTASCTGCGRAASRWSTYAVPVPGRRLAVDYPTKWSETALFWARNVRVLTNRRALFVEESVLLREPGVGAAQLTLEDLAAG